MRFSICQVSYTEIYTKEQANKRQSSRDDGNGYAQFEHSNLVVLRVVQVLQMLDLDDNLWKGKNGVGQKGERRQWFVSGECWMRDR